MILCGEVPLIGLTFAPNAIQGLTMENVSLKMDDGVKVWFFPLGNSLDACDLVLFPHDVVVLKSWRVAPPFPVPRID